MTSRSFPSAFGLALSLLFALALSMAGPLHARAASSALGRIQQQGVLTVAMFREDVAPFFYTDAGGNLVGIDPTLAHDIAEKLGVRVVFDRSATTFDGVVEKVRSGTADIAISLLSDTLERAARVSFSRSYVSVRQFLLINRLEFGKLAAERRTGNAADSVVTLLDDPASRIGVISGTSYIGFLKQDFPRAQMVEFGDWRAMLAAVKTGELVALMYDEIEIGNWRHTDPAGSLDLRPFHLTGHPDTIAIAVNRDDQDLKAWIDLYLGKSGESGFLQSILDSHLYSADRGLAND
ncbi:MAG TPA: ABC transporter substrate-binding protein [Shinella sp.]|jgi:ABC-type amino acid transport substrate-binding protein|uniref:substrate-binding periplasmic protein n=1 Tax=Shinella sp. TaxID=1870904 RepID=UPI0029A815FC|nr:ABC transporter substrate-binding protein [Shinella sp.]MDX3975530.1 ABC transporter substrate-binding protein [Shinella sp.]HEV7247542.1 ABC transporter substrate-binding protein [Shinella sp.]